MNRMLINATHKDEELRIALANGQYLYDQIIESISSEKKQANVYKGIITRVEPSLEAAFVDYGAGRHGFLPLKEVARSCFKPSYVDHHRRPSIIEVLEEGQELIVQVEKEERGNKGAALTTFITLPGCYLVLMPNNPRAGGVSRRIEGDERDELHSILSGLQLPDGMGLIVRTAGSGKSTEELQWDLEILLRLWNAILEASREKPGPFLIYREDKPVIRALRDYLRKDIDEVLIDQAEVYEEVINHLKLIRPDFVNRVKLYQDATPLFTRFQIESQIESAFQREVRLPSGGSITIDHTEALVSIDINSAKSTKGGDIEETALMTNLEAANEIARQLRLRDIGGLIVIDFIDMTPIRNQRDIEDCLRKALEIDRARVQIGRISRFGLLEMSRQRLRPSLGESSRIICPRCQGQGAIREIESLSLSIIRLIEEEAIKDNTARVQAMVPIEIAAFILNEKRQSIIDIEHRQQVAVAIIPAARLLTPQYEVERIRTSDTDEKVPSYKLANKPEAQPVTQTHHHHPQKTTIEQPTAKPVPAVETLPPPQAPAPKEKSEPGILKKFFSFLFDKKTTQGTSEQSTQTGARRHSKIYPNNTRRRPQHGNRANPRHRSNKDNRDNTRDINRDNVRDNTRDTSRDTGRDASKEQNKDNVRDNSNRQQHHGHHRSNQQNRPTHRDNRPQRDATQQSSAKETAHHHDEHHVTQQTTSQPTEKTYQQQAKPHHHVAKVDASETQPIGSELIDIIENKSTQPTKAPAREPHHREPTHHQVHVDHQPTAPREPATQHVANQQTPTVKETMQPTMREESTTHETHRDAHREYHRHAEPTHDQISATQAATMVPPSTSEAPASDQPRPERKPRPRFKPHHRARSHRNRHHNKPAHHANDNQTANDQSSQQQPDSTASHNQQQREGQSHEPRTQQDTPPINHNEKNE